MEIKDKHVILFLVLLLLIIISVFGLKPLSNEFYSRGVNLITGKSILNSCATDNTLFKVSSSTNAHAAVYTDTSYSFKACTGSLIVTDRTCNANNVIIKLSSNTNAHVEKPTGAGNYAIKVCSSDLICNYRSSSCNGDETCVASISSDTNAHVGDCTGGYNTKLCCKSSGCSLNSCESNVCDTQNTCQTNGCLWDNTNNKCCSPGKIFDPASNSCIYDPNGVTVILDLNPNTAEYLDHADFAFNGKKHSLKFDSLDSAGSQTTITVSSLPKTDVLDIGITKDYNLDNDISNINDYRVRLNTILDPDPSTGKASFTYIISDSGLCSSNTCSTNSVCNKGFGYCTLGTECNFYPPNKKSPEGGCCPDGKRWDTLSNPPECINFRSETTCLNFNTYRPDNKPYTEVCCQVATAYGFWDPVTIYNPPT